MLLAKVATVPFDVVARVACAELPEGSSETTSVILLPRGISVVDASLLLSDVVGTDKYICTNIEVELVGEAAVLLAKRTEEDDVALAAEIPVTTTAVPVAATPAPVARTAFVVLFANGAGEDTAVDLVPLVVTLADEPESPVAKADPVEVVAFTEDAVVFCDAFQVKGG